MLMPDEVIAVNRVPENGGEEIQREKSAAVRPRAFERLLDDHARRIDEKRREKHADDDKDGDGVAAFHREALAWEWARAMASALR